MVKHPKKRRHKREGKDLKRPSMSESADRHALYEVAVQSAGSDVDFVDAEFQQLRGRQAQYLREDFCGTANVSCEWVQRRVGNVATGVDLDPEVLAWGRAHHVESLSPDAQQRIALLEGNVMQVETAPQDVVLAMNFSYWVFKERAALRAYFKRTHGALADDGVFFLDCFGGYDTFRVLKESTKHDGFTYVWDQAAYNPVNGHFQCNIHFRFKDGSRIKNAFSYDGRLWTIPEIRELLDEARIHPQRGVLARMGRGGRRRKRRIRARGECRR